MRELNQAELDLLIKKKGILNLLRPEIPDFERALKRIKYESDLENIQIEVIQMQQWAINNGKRIIIIFEGRDSAGKGGAIRRITERINPRHYRIVALPKPTPEEQTQWYFQRYVKQFPQAGEIVFFDRSWYNRAVVEPVNGFCTEEEYQIFMKQVTNFEQMITESGIKLVKIYMSISKKEQAKRFDDLKNSPLKQWKMSKVDEKAQEIWESYTFYKNKMFTNTKNNGIPFKVIKANRKTDARVEVIEHLLKNIPYDKNREV